MSDVILRDIRESDLPVFFQHQLDQDAVAMAAFPSRDRDAFTAHWAKILADPLVLNRTIELDGAVAGYVASWSDEHRLIGYWLGKEYWGKGIASRALSMFLEILPVRPLHAFVANHNAASIRVLEKCGFRVLREEPGELVMVLGMS